MSKVMRTSIVAVGASADFFVMGLERLGANAEDKRLEIFCLSQTVVMLSGKSLCKYQYLSYQIQKEENIRALHDENIVFLSQSKAYSTFCQLLLPRLPKPIRITYTQPVRTNLLSVQREIEPTRTQTQNLNMISQTRVRQREHCRRKEHSLVIRMRNQQTNPLIPQLRELSSRHGNSVQPCHDD